MFSEGWRISITSSSCGSDRYTWRGASTIKNLKQILRYIKTIKFLFKHLKVVPKCCLKFFHGTFYCCVRYSNIEYEDENL